MSGEEIGSWAWSSNGERYGETFKTKKDAIDDARVSGCEGSVYVAQVSVVPKASEAVLSVFSSDELSERAEEYLSDNYGIGDGAGIEGNGALWSILAAAIEPVVMAWEKEHGVYVNWYQVGESELVDLEAAP